MLICAFSDIHGNGPAFEAALPSLRRERADLYLFLGDLCGYYYDQLPMLDMLRSLPNLAAIRGNHDQMFLDIAKGDAELRESYRNGFGHSMERLMLQDHQALLAWIEELPLWFRDKEHGLLACHGTPADPLNGRCYPDSPAPVLDSKAVRFLFTGHTHYRMNRRAGAGRLVNPGSLGQPRDGMPACYALADTDADSVAFRDVPFDSGPLRKAALAAGDGNHYLCSILDRM